jgi:uncharacterized membrane protein
MNWYLVIKFLHILAIAITTGGMFARQLVRANAKKTDDIKVTASLTHTALRIDRLMVIPWSSLMIVLGVLLALMQNWPIFGFLQGSTQNWLLVSIILLIIMQAMIFGVFIPHNKKVEALLKSSLAEGRVSQELTAALDNRKNCLAHHVEEIIIILVAALMVLKPF